MSERGTEMSAFDFAKYNEILLGNESIIIANRKKIFNKFEKFLIDALSNIKLIKKNNFKIFSRRQRSTFSKFAENFNLFFYDDPAEIDLICKDNKVAVLMDSHTPWDKMITFKLSELKEQTEGFQYYPKKKK